MYLGERLRLFREAKHLSQGDIERRTGLLRCYISRVENGHTVPSVETLEKIARACEVKLYQIFYEGESATEESPNGVRRRAILDWASRGKGQRLFTRICSAVSRASEGDKQVILHLAQKLSQKPKMNNLD